MKYCRVLPVSKEIAAQSPKLNKCLPIISRQTLPMNTANNFEITKRNCKNYEITPCLFITCTKREGVIKLVKLRIRGICYQFSLILVFLFPMIFCFLYNKQNKQIFSKSMLTVGKEDCFLIWKSVSLPFQF